MNKTIIKNAQIVNEGKTFISDVLIEDERISRIDQGISIESAHNVIEAEGLYLLPGFIDDQVHFREPGLTHKADIASESKAAVAGGTTTVFDMPNTTPPAVTREAILNKISNAIGKTHANYSAYLGATNDN